MANTHSLCLRDRPHGRDQLKLYADCSAISAIYIVKIDIQVPLINYILWGGGATKCACLPP